MAKGPLRLLANFKVKCFGSQCNVNEIGKYVPPYPRSRTAEVEVVSETRLEESTSRLAPCNVLASDTIVESAEKLDEAVTSGSGVTKRRRHSVRLALASAAAEEAHVVDDENYILRKRKRTSITITIWRWQEVWSERFTWVEKEFDGAGNLMGVVCSICTRIDGRKKVIVSKGDNRRNTRAKGCANSMVSPTLA
jgi:hypothetical protein